MFYPNQITHTPPPPSIVKWSTLNNKFNGLYSKKKGKGYINDKKHITDTTSNIPKEPRVTK